MSASILLRAAALVLSLSAAHALAAPQAGTPHMRHSAPFVGQVLTLDVEGAVPLSPIYLLSSPGAGSFQTPYGLLELQRNQVHRVTSGMTSATGTWTFDIPIPLDSALAETQRHYQALVDDPSAPAGRVFSDAVHMRLLGPRVYAGYQSDSWPARAGLYIVSGVTDSIVARVDYGMISSVVDSKPVFDATFSRGAVMSTPRELLFFDPFFGQVQQRVAFASDCSSTLLCDLARQIVYVLETGTPARVHAVDFSSGSETSHQDLPNVATSLWCSGGVMSEAFLCEMEPGGRTALRHVGLEPLADLGSRQVGGPNSTAFENLVYSAGQIFVSTSGAEVGPPPHWQESFLDRCRVTAAGIVGRTTALGRTSMSHLTAIPAADRLLAGQMYTDWGPLGWLCQMPLSRVAPPTVAPWPPTGFELYVHDIEPDQEVAWIIGDWEWQHSDLLYRFDMHTNTWTVTPHWWLFGPSDMEVLRDAWNHEVWVANIGYAPPIDIDPEILVVDELDGSSRHIPLGHTAKFLHAVPLP